MCIRDREKEEIALEGGIENVARCLEGATEGDYRRKDAKDITGSDDLNGDMKEEYLGSDDKKKDYIIANDDTANDGVLKDDSVVRCLEVAMEGGDSCKDMEDVSGSDDVILNNEDLSMKMKKGIPKKYFVGMTACCSENVTVTEGAKLANDTDGVTMIDPANLNKNEFDVTMEEDVATEVIIENAGLLKDPKNIVESHGVNADQADVHMSIDGNLKHAPINADVEAGNFTKHANISGQDFDVKFELDELSLDSDDLKKLEGVVKNVTGDVAIQDPNSNNNKLDDDDDDDYVMEDAGTDVVAEGREKVVEGATMAMASTTTNNATASNNNTSTSRSSSSSSSEGWQVVGNSASSGGDDAKISSNNNDNDSSMSCDYESESKDDDDEESNDSDDGDEEFNFDMDEDGDDDEENKKDGLRSDGDLSLIGKFFDVDLLRDCIKRSEESLKHIEGKDVVLVVGKTGTGKSTFIQGIAGKTFRKSSFSCDDKNITAKDVFEADDPIPGFEIGHAKSSMKKQIRYFVREYENEHEDNTVSNTNTKDNDNSKKKKEQLLIKSFK